MREEVLPGRRDSCVKVLKPETAWQIKVTEKGDKVEKTEMHQAEA